MASLSFPALLTTGKPFLKALEQHHALAVYAPLEGGFEGRYLRRLRTKGYRVVSMTARGLGDLESYLNGVHGVRPPHLGKKNVGKEASVGPVYFVPPILSCRLGELTGKERGVVLWLVEGQVLSKQERTYLINLTVGEPKFKVVLEMGGGRSFGYKPLAEVV
ncbi:MAG: NAD(P)H-quinone oxidoreductase subunit N [Synechococcales cyanobacterium RM1_1_8]|nr:NAD(P)H-quinone oxidoreductase subunit N [Synechococcales cyanobacterium RM1_1_8]